MTPYCTTTKYSKRYRKQVGAWRKILMNAEAMKMVIISEMSPLSFSKHQYETCHEQ